MPLYQILFLVLLVFLLAYIGISSEMKRRSRPFALTNARKILVSLRGKNDFLLMTSPETKASLLRTACEEADVTLKELGTSEAELKELCCKSRKNRV